MQLSPLGKIAQKYWYEIPQYFPFIRLDEMVVMPNHIHGILWIDKSLDIADDDAVDCMVDDDALDRTVDDDTVDCTADDDAVDRMADDDVVDRIADDDVVDCIADDGVVDCRDAINRVSTETETETETNETKQKIGGITGKNNPMFYKNISRVIRWYKGRCTFEIGKPSNFAWQPRFYDRIICDENELNRIRKYIVNNPEMWQRDRNNG